MADTNKRNFKKTETGYSVTRGFIDETINNIKGKRTDWSKDEIKHLLKTNDEMAIKSLLKIYNLQTEDEKDSKETSDHNNIGFNAYDAKPLSDIAEQIVKNKFITHAQVSYVRSKLIKYSGQLASIANGEV